MQTKLPSLSLCLLVLLSLPSCVTSGGSDERAILEDGQWLLPSPLLEQQIADEAARLPWTHGFERLESIRWFASVGEPAFETLLEMATHERADVAAAALAALGATGDPRLVLSIREVRFFRSESGSDLELERARTLLRLGDWDEIPSLVHGLRDERLYTRMLCFEALREATREDLGFNPRATASEREVAVGRWESWWLGRGREGLVRRPG